MLSWLDIILRFGAAMVTGSLIGIYLELHQKPTGIRTLGLVALASAVVVLAVAKDPDADASRVIQGVITGVGFLGAGVILHRGRGGQVVHGLRLRRQYGLLHPWAYCVVSLLGNSWPLRSSLPSSS
jgi:putative Mg2+ transporter-C (MgtC) family protein